jgi:putative DNA primase/helicase
MGLKGLRLACASETDEGRHFSSAKVKWLAGGDQLVGRNPHDKYDTRFAPTHTLFLMTNNKPGVTSGDDFAFWERMHLIPFTVSFVTRLPQENNEREADKYIAEKLKAEASGILSWLVKGCLDYQRHGLPLPQAVTDATLEYREDEDLLGQFVDAYLIRDPGAKTKSSAIFDVFNRWYKKNMSSKGISHKRFGTMMKRKFKDRKLSGVVHYVGVAVDQYKAAELGED